MRSFLQNIKPDKVGANYGDRNWLAWHGDSKSQSNASAGQLTFTIKSMVDTQQNYITIITQKGKDTWFVKYKSPTWEDARTIINKMVEALIKNNIK